MLPLQMVPIQLKVLMALGTAMTIVETPKAALSVRFIPLTYMWCPQTTKPRKPMAIIAQTIALYPKIGLREKTARISDAKPIAGRIRM